MDYPAKGTVRWYVSEYVCDQLEEAPMPVLEIGSRRGDGQWWRDLCGHAGVDRDLWTGLDMESGPNVDVVCDITRCPKREDLFGQFGTVVCAEVLEHVAYPLVALHNLRRFLAPGGKLIVTVPFAFPIHNFPHDYWRFAPDGLRLMLTDCGFSGVEVTQMHMTKMELRDHDETVSTRLVPMHIGAIGWRRDA